MKRRYGSGSIFLRKRTLWIAYRVGGRLVRESTHSDVKRVAERLLRERLTGADGGLVTADSHKVLLTDLRKLVIDDYEANKRKSKRNLKAVWKHVLDHFGEGARAREVTSPAVERYKTTRLAAGAKPATVNRELAALRRGFRLAQRRGMLAARPEFSLVREDNARQGFFEAREFAELLKHLPEWLAPVARFMYVTGWRRAEVLNLKWDQVDRDARVIRIEDTKSGEARTLPYGALAKRLVALIDAQHEARRGDYVFHDGRGYKIHAYDEAWKLATKAAGLKGRLVHDFRRTAVRNLERAGVSRSVAMRITGHKTESIYKRYAIVSESDISEGLKKLGDDV